MNPTHLILTTSILLLQQTISQPNPCTNIADNAFTVIPGTGCKEYVQCLNAEVSTTLTCAGDTIYDINGQYCNWPASVNCVDPTPSPVAISQGETNIDTIDITAPTPCPNPCHGTSTGYKIIPNTNCKQYVQCSSGEAISEVLNCDGDTVFNSAGYCDWSSNTACLEVECPEVPVPTGSPVEMPSVRPSVAVVTTGSPVTGGPLSTTPTTLTASAENNDNTTTTATTTTSTTLAQTASQFITTIDCSTPCPPGSIGFNVYPNTNCSKYAQCNDGLIIKDFECPSGTMFAEGGCKFVDGGEGNIYAGDGTVLCPEVKCTDGTNPTTSPSVSPTSAPSRPPTASTLSNLPTVVTPTTSPSTSQVTITIPVIVSPPTIRPAQPKVPIYNHLRAYLTERESIMNSIIFQSQSGPSVEYTHSDMMNALNVAVYQLPISLSFYVGEHSEVWGINYALVNMAAFLANAMVEGIKYDSCDEWNTDDINGDSWRYPLSNSCGQYGRNYGGEICREDVDSMCPIDTAMNITANSSPHSPGPPPFTCGPTIPGTYAGYYDSQMDSIVETAYANSLGEINVEGCCYWGRGALLTRGRCILGKLNKYLGKQAAEEGFDGPYRYVDFCSDPNAICLGHLSRELRWSIAFLEWAEEVQNYIHVDEYNNKWTYWDRLKSFVDGGMVDATFIEEMINILVRKCHNAECNNYEIPHEEERKNNFQRIIGEVFRLPLPEVHETWHPTSKPTKRKKDQILALPPNSGYGWVCGGPLVLTAILTVMQLIL